MSAALPGAHLCVEHQGNHSHYATENCAVCILLAALRKIITTPGTGGKVELIAKTAIGRVT